MEQNPYGPTSVQPKIPISPVRDLAYDGLSFVLCFLFCQWVLFGGLGIAVPIVLGLAYALAFAYLSREKLHFTFSFFCTGVPVLLLLLCFLFYDNLTLRALNVLILLFLIPLNLSYLAGRNEYAFFCAGSLLDGLKALFVFPFSNFGRAFSMPFARGRHSRQTSAVLKALVGILLISPVAIVVTLLLMSSDQRFSNVISDGLRLIGTNWMPNVGKLLLAVLLTCPAYGFYYALRYGTHNPQTHGFELSKRLRLVDVPVVNSALWVVCMIYLLYISTQISYFFSAFVMRLPSGISTYSEYARRGFFELTAVCAINFFLIAVAMLFSKRSGNTLYRASRITIFALSVLTLMLILTAGSKMFMYIQKQGMTPLRVYTSAFMLFLLAVFVFLIIKMFTDKFNFLRSSAIAAIVLYLGLNFMNPDAMIAHHNLALYQAQLAAGQTASLDTDLLFSLSDSALPEAKTLLLDKQCGAQTRAAFSTAAERLKNQRWESFTVAGAIARGTVSAYAGG